MKRTIGRFLLGLLLLLWCGDRAFAQVVNGSFEEPFLSGWTTGGDVQPDSLVTPPPTDGSVVASLETGSGAVAEVTLEAFLGLSLGSLDALGGGDVTEGSGIFQAFAASAGEHYAFDWVLLPELVQNDFAFVAIDGTPAVLGDAVQAGDEFETFCFSVTSTGTTELAIGVIDVVDTAGASELLVDNVRQVPDIDVDGIPDPCDDAICGNGLVEGSELCDDGNLDDNDCCSPTCTVPMPTCGSAGKSSLIIKDKPEDTKDSLTWKWLKGDATTQTDFADPTDMTPYHLCLYAGTAASIADIELPAGSPSWKATGTKGFKYKDKTTAVDGVKKVVLKGGAAGKAKVIVQGKGTMLPDLAPPLALPVVARIINGDSGACWASTFGDVVKNESGLFKAKSP